MSRTSVSTHSPAPRSRKSPARRAVAACGEAGNAIRNANPIVAGAFEDRTRRRWKMRIAERADRDGITARMVRGLPIDCRAAIRTEIELQKTPLDVALIHMR